MRIAVFLMLFWPATSLAQDTAALPDLTRKINMVSMDWVALPMEKEWKSYWDTAYQLPPASFRFMYFPDKQPLVKSQTVTLYFYPANQAATVFSLILKAAMSGSGENQDSGSGIPEFYTNEKWLILAWNATPKYTSAVRQKLMKALDVTEPELKLESIEIDQESSPSPPPPPPPPPKKKKG